ncbi:DUF2236 domain-containing protein [Nocardioides marmoriginsengisoli]|uniref:DUF2236 domain-containing protein n=1 Tax=Nocardioides marmoriginsengisoli TaxID=661483 RepID=A0A3N0CD16_9ACTN|nr:oxygenase MpaB family protein [Nocardioides marmoriginsengisoli]RNL61354.1 DUF2236 domain-containing protein [Nocardioides marmoriginsengisoli]
MTLLDEEPAAVAVSAQALVPLPDVSAAPYGLSDYVGEACLLLGAGSAVMNQLALVGVGKGVAEHSNTFERPLDRLRTTLTYVYALTLGTEVERKAIARMVNKAHGPIKGDGYTAFDPKLQLWVAATLTAGGEQMYEKTFGPMDEASRERAYREGWILGTALQVTEDMWPRTRAEFSTYWESMQAELSPDPHVQAYARQLLSARDAAWYLAGSVALQSLLTRGNLTAQVREVLDLPWRRRDQWAYDAFWAVFRTTYRLVPKRLRTLHSRLLVKDMRKRMRANRRVI